MDISDRNNGKTDYFAGPLSPDAATTNATDCSNWDRHFLVRSERIAAFLASLPVLQNNPAVAKTQFPDILGWPGRGNPYFTDLAGFDLPFTIQGLAPFYDADQDGLYDPLQGDYPAVVLRGRLPFIPTQMVWCVFNEEGAGALHAATAGEPIRVEVQLTAWAFDSVAEPLLANTVFTSHKLIFRNTDVLDSCFVGMWADLDIGCYADDYVGSAPALDAFYGYNQDAVDGFTGNTCGTSLTFSGAAPVQSATLLNLSMDKFMSINDGGTIPSAGPGPIYYYKYLTGHWPDDTPLTFGDNGHQSGAPTNLAYPNDPADPAGWSMCTANLAPSDRRVLASHQFGQVSPGQVEELNIAWTVHPNPNLPCGLGTTFTDIAAIRELYNNNFVTATTTPLLVAPVVLSPNPATQTVNISYDELAVQELRCYDAAGRLVRMVPWLPEHQYTLDVANWRNGAYTVQLLTNKGSVARRLVVLH